MKRSLDRSGLEVSALGMGCWAIGGPWTRDQPGEDPFPAGWGRVNDVDGQIYSIVDTYRPEPA